ncbi:RNA polymerase sigma factor [Chryseomicrobium palamuruense]|uniref:RNA polymerase sigma factor n=1 Tax=Chryseomicrobium palamuruense TaxID=682973 RepID=A0ABV8UVX8_9BACL
MTTFEEVAEAYQPMISSILRKTQIYRDHDVFRQAATIALWKVWETYDESKGSFAGFAYRSMYGAVLDELKRTSKDIPLDTPFFEQLTTWKEEECFLDILKDLSDAQQKVIILSYIYGYTALEIAHLLNISEAGVKKRKKVALRVLRELITNGC